MKKKMEKELTILYLDEHLVAVEKPAGLIVHRNEFTQGELDNVLSRTRNQIGKYVYPVHRLDRPTAGVMILALSKEASKILSKAFVDRKIDKYYLAVVKGDTAAEGGMMDRPLRNKPKPDFQEALTYYKTLSNKVLPIPLGPYDTTTYSLIEAHPITGRYHQIRRHLSYIHHAILGDKKHGHSQHNELFREQLNLPGLMLQSYRLEFDHPISGEPIKLKASIAPHIQAVLDQFGWTL